MTEIQTMAPKCRLDDRISLRVAGLELVASSLSKHSCFRVRLGFTAGEVRAQVGGKERLIHPPYPSYSTVH